MLAAAPFFDDVSQAPGPQHSFWLTASDGVRTRAGIWSEGLNGPPKGTVLLFPGRTEYVEKYAITARDFAKRGYATVVNDWRGQGLADRLLPDRLKGHVTRFSDYQKDVTALMNGLQDLDLPKPYYLLAHSMGGAIGLRAVLDGLPVAATAFTGPMWGILISPLMRPVAWALSFSARQVGLGHLLVPSTKINNYVLTEPFENNVLTSDPATFALLQQQLKAHPDLELGGPSLHWLLEALLEIRYLWRITPQELNILAMIGSNERINDSRAIQEFGAAWPKSRVEIICGAEHEILMERPEIRTPALDQIDAHFQAAA